MPDEDSGYNSIGILDFFVSQIKYYILRKRLNGLNGVRVVRIGIAINTCFSC